MSREKPLFNGTVVAPSRRVLLLGTRTTTPTEPRVVGMRSIKSLSISLGVMLYEALPPYIPWVLGQHFQSTGDTAPY